MNCILKCPDCDALFGHRCDLERDKQMRDCESRQKCGPLFVDPDCEFHNTDAKK